MANWVAAILEANPELIAWPVVKQARRSLHLRRPDGKTLGLFTSGPIHYQDEQGEWQPIDTTPIHDDYAGLWYCPGLKVGIGDTATVSLAESDYVQKTTRIGLFRPSTQELLATRDVPLGQREGDALVAERDEWRVERRITATGYRELLTLKVKPDIPQVQVGDFLVLETLIWGITLPNGWVEGEYAISEHWSPMPVAWDANNEPLTCRRYWRDGVLYTGIPVTELAHAVYPVTIDPDFTSSTADGYVNGQDNTYATARSIASGSNITAATFLCGQRFIDPEYRVYRGFLKFDTSGIGAGQTITQVNLNMTVAFDNSATDFDVQIIKQGWSAQDPLAAGNMEAAYDNCLAGAADDNIWRNTAGIAVNTNYTSGNLDVTWPDPLGDTYYSLRSSRDFAATTPTALEYISLCAQEHATAVRRPYLTILYEAAGGETFYQAVAGAFTSAGVVTKKTETPRAGAITFVGVSLRTMQFARTILAGAISFVGTSSRTMKFARSVLAGALTMSGTVIGKAKKVLTGALTSSGVLIGKAKKVLAGTFTSAGVLSKKTSTFLAGVLTSAGALVKKTVTSKAGAITFTGTSSRTMRFARTVLSGVITLAGVVAKKTSLSFAGALTSSGVLISKAKKLLVGSLMPSGISTKKTTKSFDGTLTYVGTLTIIRVFHRILTGATTFTGTLTRKTGKVLTGAVTLAGTISKLTRKILSGALTFIGRVTGIAPVRVIHLTLYDRSTALTLNARSTNLTLEPRSTDLTLPSR